MVIRKNISKFYKKYQYLSYFLFYLRFGEKYPPLIRPWGTTLHKDLAIFFFISLDPKEAKSAKKSISIFLNRLSP